MSGSRPREAVNDPKSNAGRSSAPLRDRNSRISTMRSIRPAPSQSNTRRSDSAVEQLGVGTGPVYRSVSSEPRLTLGALKQSGPRCRTSRATHQRCAAGSSHSPTFSQCDPDGARASVSSDGCTCCRTRRLKVTTRSRQIEPLPKHPDKKNPHPANRMGTFETRNDSSRVNSGRNQPNFPEVEAIRKAAYVRT